MCECALVLNLHCKAMHVITLQCVCMCVCVCVCVWGGGGGVGNRQTPMRVVDVGWSMQ